MDQINTNNILPNLNGADGTLLVKGCTKTRQGFHLEH